jgi:hypothetical protein
MKMNWKNKTLLALSIIFVSGCASNIPTETNTATAGSKKSSANNNAFYAPGSKTLDRSQTAVIINKSQATTIVSAGGLKVPQPLFGKQHKVFITPPGKATFTINYNSNEGTINGNPKIEGNVEAGKTYELRDSEFARRVSFTLTDIKTKQETKMVWPNGVHPLNERRK